MLVGFLWVCCSRCTLIICHPIVLMKHLQCVAIISNTRIHWIQNEFWWINNLERSVMFKLQPLSWRQSHTAFLMHRKCRSLNISANIGKKLVGHLEDFERNNAAYWMGGVAKTLVSLYSIWRIPAFLHVLTEESLGVHWRENVTKISPIVLSALIPPPLHWCQLGH